MTRIHRTMASGLIAALFAAAVPASAEAPPRQTLDLLTSERASPFAGKSPAQKMQELVDREEIEELINVYAHRATLGINIADLFTDDGALITQGRGTPAINAQGRAAIDKIYAGISSNPGAQLPMVHNLVLAIAGDNATGVVSVEVRGNQNGENVIASGYYNDTFRRENGRWKFVKREVNFHHYTTLEKGWATKPAQLPAGQ